MLKKKVGKAVKYSCNWYSSDVFKSNINIKLNYILPEK